MPEQTGECPSTLTELSKLDVVVELGVLGSGTVWPLVGFL